MEDIMVKFTPLKSSKVPKEENGTLDGTLDGTLEEKILTLVRENPKLTQSQIAAFTESSERSVKRMMKSMLEREVLERIGGRRHGYWKEKQ